MRLERKGAHPESFRAESVLAEGYHALFAALGVADHVHGEPLAWLKDGIDLAADGAGGVLPWVAAHNRLRRYNTAKQGAPEELEYEGGDAMHQEADLALRAKLRAIVGRLCVGTDVRSKSIVETVVLALAPIHLLPLKEEQKGRQCGRQRRNMLQRARFGEPVHEKLQCSLADAVMIRARGVECRASAFAIAQVDDEEYRGDAVSDAELEDVEPPAGAGAAAPRVHELLRPFDGAAPREEGYDAGAVRKLLGVVRAAAPALKAALAKATTRLQSHASDMRVRARRQELQVALDVQRVAEGLDEVLGAEDGDGRRFLRTACERVAPLGGWRTRALSDKATAVRVQALVPDEDPCASSFSRPLGYGGLLPEMLGLLGGRTSEGRARLSIVRVCPFSLARDAAARIDKPLDELPELHAVAADPDAAIEDVRREYFPDGGGRDASAQLLKDVLYRRSHKAWLKRHGFAEHRAKMALIANLQAEVEALSLGLLSAAAYKDGVDRLRATLASGGKEGRALSAKEERTLWIRWLQWHQGSVLQRIELILHTQRRQVRMPWFKESTCPATKRVRHQSPPATPWRQWVDEEGFTEKMRAHRPLCPVAMVGGGLLVQDARVDEEASAASAGGVEGTVVDSAPSLAGLCMTMADELLPRSEHGGWRAIRLIPEALPVYAAEELPTLVRGRAAADDITALSEQWRDEECRSTPIPKFRTACAVLYSSRGCWLGRAGEGEWSGYGATRHGDESAWETAVRGCYASTRIDVGGCKLKREPDVVRISKSEAHVVYWVETPMVPQGSAHEHSQFTSTWPLELARVLKDEAIVKSRTELGFAPSVLETCRAFWRG